MIKLQSSMSKHIPVSPAALSPGCHFVFYFVVVSPLWLLLKISALPFPGWPSRVFGEITPCQSPAGFKFPTVNFR